MQEEKEKNKYASLPKNVTVVGAGAVAKFALPTLLQLFKFKADPEHRMNVTVFDADAYEEKNLDRQLTDQSLLGKAKAEVLVDGLKEFCLIPHSTVDGEERPCSIIRLKAEVGWFHDGTEVREKSGIFCFADNNAAFVAALEVADDTGSVVFRGANEYESSQAMFYEPSMKGTPMDPRVRFPEIVGDDTDNPITATACTGEAQVETPQLVISNLRAASQVASLMWCRWGGASKGVERGSLPLQLDSNFYIQNTLSESACDNQPKNDNRHRNEKRKSRRPAGKKKAPAK